MDKQVQFAGQAGNDVFCQGLFGSTGAFEKTAGAPPFSDWATGDDLRRYIQKVSAADRKRYCYVLVNALGASEYFGSNINADWFPWESLAHEGEDYGYRTFMAAHAYQHHKNKDPTRAFGVPVLSVLNVPMKRVELIVRLDREKAKIEGAEGIVDRVDRGEFPDVSMGCRVPWDVCSICQHRSKTKADYCVHMNPPEELRHMYGPNRLMPDGRRICVHNIFPRFFDISFVFIGADKTAKAMAKLASADGMNCFGDVCAIPRLSTDVHELTSSGIYLPSSKTKTASACDCECGTCGGMDKIAAAMGVKIATKNKAAEIVKQIPANQFSIKRLPAMEASEPTLPKDTLDALSEHAVGDVCSTAGAAGLVLKPQEFQRIILVRMGDSDFADELDERNLVFRHVPKFDDSIPYDPTLKKRLIIALLKEILADRTAFGEPFARRTIGVVSRGEKKPLPTPVKVSHPLLDKISAAYNGYRRNILTKLSQAVHVAESDPQLRESLLGHRLFDAFGKIASAPTFSLDSMSYLAGAYLTEGGLLSNTAVAEAVAVANHRILQGGGFE